MREDVGGDEKAMADVFGMEILHLGFYFHHRHAWTGGSLRWA